MKLRVKDYLVTMRLDSTSESDEAVSSEEAGGMADSKGSSLFTDVWEREAALILRARFRCSDCLIRGMITIQSNCNIFPDKTECAVRVVKRTKEQKCTPSSVVHFCFSF